MDFNDTTILRLAKTQMRYQGQRQALLSQNIANIDTPGFAAQDLKPLNFSHMAELEAKRLEIRATSPAHMMGVRDNSGPFRDEKSRYSFETTPVKNNVALEEQMAKINLTGINFQMASGLYKKMNTMVKSALGVR